ncbi:hypothetical protein Tco_1132704 [Tanacetum coccineum]|uniref:Uncharacterized protein n=1 Tax=Tanacetum coccineum TaxID=301880 RepID=A0ABQ5JFR5_9ASTR
METQKPLLKDEDGKEVNVHMYRSMIGSLMYLTSLRPDIMFAVCACARYQVNPKVSHLHVVKMIFRYLKGQPKLGLWYPKDSPFDLVAYTDSDYAGASLDRKSKTGGCQFLGCRLISWQCTKQTVVANSTTEAKYVAASRKAKKSVKLMMEKLFRMELELMLCLSPKTTAWNEFSSTMASAIICSAIPTDPHHTPTIIQSSIQPQKTQKPRKPKRKDTKLPQLSDPIENVAEEAIYKELGDSLVRAATTASSLEAEQDSARVESSDNEESSGEDASKHGRINYNTLCFQVIDDVNKSAMYLLYCTYLLEVVNVSSTGSRPMLIPNLEKTKTIQRNEIASLKRRVKKLENKNRSRTHMLERLYKVGLTARVESSDNEESLGEDASKQGRIDAIDADEEITLVKQEVVVKDVNDEVNVVEVINTAKLIGDATTEKGVVIQELGESTTTISSQLSSQQSPDKGKRKLIEPVKPIKKKDLIRLDEEAALKLQAEFDEEERLAREKVKKEKEANIALIETWDDIQAKIDVDHQLLERLQAQEQEELSVEEKATLFQQLLEKRRKHFAAKRAEEKRNKPPIKAQ